jgi:hypothetical protein
MRLPRCDGWKMVVNGIGIPLAPTSGMEHWREDIWLHRRVLSPEERADPTWMATGNNAWWMEFFNTQCEEELCSIEGLIGSPTSWNREGAGPFLGRVEAHPRRCHPRHHQRLPHARDATVTAAISIPFATDLAMSLFPLACRLVYLCWYLECTHQLLIFYDDKI